MLDRQSRGFLGQLGGLLAINLAFGLLFPGIDNLAHIGGLVSGMWIGALFVPSRVPTDASQLYARNLVNFLGLVIDKASKTVKVNWEDEIVTAVALTRDGAVVHPSLKPKAA